MEKTKVTMPSPKNPRFFRVLKIRMESNILLGFLVVVVGFFVSIFKVWGFKEWLCFFLKEMFVLKKFSSKLWNPQMLTTNHDLLIDC